MYNRRDFLLTSAGVAGASLIPSTGFAEPADLPESIRSLNPMPDDVVPISDNERLARIGKAQRLMEENKIDAIVMEGGTSMRYFADLRWGNSERTFALVIPARGELAWICPAFEEQRARELIRFGTEVRTWEEDGSPFKLLGSIFKDRGVRWGRIGLEERLRVFIFEGLRRDTSGFEFVDAVPVTAGCRMIKSPAELALMQKANVVTIEAYKASFGNLKEGMTQNEFGGLISAAFRKLGFPGGAMVSFGEYTAFPHGSRTPQKVKEGDMVLVDGGCSVEGYASDITRTFVLGKPTQRQRDIWNLERKAQDAAFAAAKPGAPCEDVDAAARKVITDAGFGPEYKLPGLPHRTGHGIGMDGHEWTNFVKGNKTLMQPGMCFSDEPTICIYGEFGIRLEDCLHITDDGARMFTAQSPSIEQPFG
ncbi:MAG TPA: Xaa-Pro peptidase family protein [Bacteroidota bacterium]|nr:Xaa-Pro peptidase family protein [Bacteroidota bacterium]